jgi:uncharacterized protein (TIGR02466 family)
MHPRIADVERLRRELAANPRDRIAWHNLAAAYGDLGFAQQAQEAAQRALALGLKAPETWLVLARALQTLRRLDEAQQAFERAIALRPAYAEAHRDLAQLIWMRSGDAAAALRGVERALRAAPRAAELHLVRSLVLDFAGDRAAALAAAEQGLARAGSDLALLLQAARLAAAGGAAERALELAQRAAALAPAAYEARQCLTEALIAAGRIDEAAGIADELCRVRPLDQYALALRATVWRLRGDTRYRALYDYAAFVVPQAIDVPPGWTSLTAFLQELAHELESLHCFVAHPLQQSVRGGSQLHLQAAELARPPIAALFQSLLAAVHAYLARLGHGDDPLRARNTGKAVFTGAWSVRLRSGGSHADHVHPHGWLSSAFYVALPAEVASGADRAGWLRLGRPAIPTAPPLDAEHYVQPRAGHLVLFPAYMWHGVEPFTSPTPRLSVAFDVAPG